MRVSCIQNNAGKDLSSNLSRISHLVAQAARKKPSLIALPETCVWRGPSEELRPIAEMAPRLLKDFRSMAFKHRIAILVGSLMESRKGAGKFFNTSYLINRGGEIAAIYRKIHLFDIKLSGRVDIRESRHIQAGDRIVTAKLGGIKAGLSICYDLRFPELYRCLVDRGAQLAFVPANFTYETGKAHWECLLRARAIENQMFIIAPAQAGINPGNKVRSFGTSLIIDPWGNVLARGSLTKEAVITADLDFKGQSKLRRQFPVLRHRKGLEKA